MSKWGKWFYKWIENIQGIVEMHTVKKNKDGTGEVSQGWIFVLVTQLLFMRNKEQKGKKQGDGVMGLAFELGSILYVWAFRTQLAKCYDPARKVKERNEALKNLIYRHGRFFEMLHFETTEEDKKTYKQKWQSTTYMKKICESLR